MNVVNTSNTNYFCGFYFTGLLSLKELRQTFFFFLYSNIKFIYRFNIKDNPLTLAGNIR